MKMLITICLFLLFSTAPFGCTFGYENVPDPRKDANLVFEPFYGTGNYLDYAKYIDSKEIKIIFEIGSRDAIDAIQLGYYYNCPVYAFECNPKALEICQHNIKNYPYVTLVPLACWNETKVVSFYPVIQSLAGKKPVNIGASSLLVARKDGCDKHHVQGAPIKVQAVRLDEWLCAHSIEHIDLLCMDVQGATLQVLEGMGDYLKNIKYIITEVYLEPSFEGEYLYPEIKKYLQDKGFYVAREPPKSSFSDVLFINNSMSNKKK